jgi:hypothetical protein
MCRMRPALEALGTLGGHLLSHRGVSVFDCRGLDLAASQSVMVQAEKDVAIADFFQYRADFVCVETTKPVYVH